VKPTPPPFPPTAWHALPAPGAAPFGVFVLADPDALLDGMTDESFRASDERMPYWALLWPAGAALAEAVLAGPDLAGRRVLDLGCGVGAEGLAAARRGAVVTYLDWAAEAEPLVRASSIRLGLAVERFVCADWREPPADLGTFDLVLAADVLYEARNARPVARFLATHLAPGGEAWLTDPGRLHARTFPSDLSTAWLRLVEERPLPPPEEGATITLFRIARE
jgi:predicted nicotinamide N-methyase